jgi:chaperonin cofactor prefoldin
MSIVTEILETKEKLEKELKVLEKQIYELETSYLQETLNNGFYNFFINPNK